jgi:hypothetical protein
MLSGAVGMGFLARSVAGHCAVKAAVSGQTSLGEGIKDQWRHITRTGSNPRLAPRSAAQLSQAVDESGKQSFPASDPPSSRSPDLPPSNAAAKWAVARAAQSDADRGWKDHNEGKVTGEKVAPGAGDSEAGAPSEGVRN